LASLTFEWSAHLSRIWARNNPRAERIMHQECLRGDTYGIADFLTTTGNVPELYFLSHWILFDSTHSGIYQARDKANVRYLKAADVLGQVFKKLGAPCAHQCHPERQWHKDLCYVDVKGNSCAGGRQVTQSCRM
jgi:hypothetical protein